MMGYDCKVYQGSSRDHCEGTHQPSKENNAQRNGVYFLTEHGFPFFVYIIHIIPAKTGEVNTSRGSFLPQY